MGRKNHQTEVYTPLEERVAELIVMRMLNNIFTLTPPIAPPKYGLDCAQLTVAGWPLADMTDHIKMFFTSLHSYGYSMLHVVQRMN